MVRKNLWLYLHELPPPLCLFVANVPYWIEDVGRGVERKVVEVCKVLTYTGHEAHGVHEPDVYT